MIIVRIWEGLGNQLFQYAFAKSIQHYTRENVVLDCNKSFQDSLPGAKTSKVQRAYKLDYFQIKLNKIEMEKYRCWGFLHRENRIQRAVFALSERGFYPLRYVHDTGSYDFSEKLLHLHHAYIMGHFQNERYFKNIRKELLQDFTPKDFQPNEQIKEILGTANTVSLHIRRTDFKDLGITLDHTYYDKAIAYINDKTVNPVYLIFCDDLVWAKENINCHARSYFVSELGNFCDCEELMLMSLCTHNIIANSTFSWWGAWLNQNEEKIVIAPKRWITKSRGSHKIILKEWIKI